jgi:flagellar assembly factor FliW
MPEVITRHFGEVSWEEDAVVRFPNGLPAFEQAQRFILIERPATAPVVFLQSLDEPLLCFIALPVLALDPDYSLDITLEDLRLLGLDEDRQPRVGDEVACLSIVSVTENRPPSANLLAPIIINLKTRSATQAIRLDSRYSHQHLLTAAGVPC